MHNVPKFIPKIYLIHISGEYWEFKNLKEAAKELHRLGYFTFWDSCIGNSFDKRWTWDNFSYFQYQYIVRTEIGDVVTIEELRDILRKPRKYWYRYDYNPEKDFRNGPLRGLPMPNRSNGRRYRGRPGHYYRRFRHIQDRRWAEAHEQELKEYGFNIRCKRNRRNIPDPYDDYAPTRYGNNWKRYRKHQWKEKKSK